MPYTYDTIKKHYRSGGELIARPVVRAEVAKLSDYVGKQSAVLAKRYTSGSITLDQFHIEMRELLKAAHLVASSVGRGGRIRMTQSDWGGVGARIKKQYGYLARFVEKIAKGKITKIATESRATKYASEIYIGFSETYRKSVLEGEPKRGGAEALLVQNSREGCEECNDDAAAGWTPVEEVTPLGDRICQSFCLCVLEFRDADGNEI